MRALHSPPARRFLRPRGRVRRGEIPHEQGALRVGVADGVGMGLVREVGCGGAELKIGCVVLCE